MYNTYMSQKRTYMYMYIIHTRITIYIKSIGNPPPKGVYTCVICQQKEHDHHGRPLSNQPQIY